MTADLARVGSVLWATAVPASVLAVAGVPAEHASTIAVLAATVAAVAGGMTWLRSQMARQIEAHTNAENKLQEERHAGLLREMAHLRELIDIRGELRGLRAEVRDAIGPREPTS